MADQCSAATKVQHEPKRAQDKGAPDFKITRQAAIVGYVEAKQIGENLDAVLKTDQIKRYLELNPNLLVTDYLRFVWISNGKIKEAQSARLCEQSVLESRKAPLNSERVADVEKLLIGFFKTAPKGVKRASQLADALAVRSRLLRDFLSEELERQEKEEEGGKLLGLYKAFKEQVSHELKLEEFADAFAQTLAYGLFLAKLNVKPGQTITLSNAEDLVPGGFGLIRELVGFLKELERKEYRDIKWVVEEILSIVNWMDVGAVRDDLSFKNQRAYSRGVRARSEEEWRLFRKDPFVYFYEDYLAKYDSKLRKSRGVYYTPPPIVNFIVRAINDILKDTFEIEMGLADRERVTVLDFACGTGTFLVEVLERIFEEIGGSEAGVAPAYVREHILKNIYGFEYLIAPYTIAHLKLSQYLSELAQRVQNPSIGLREGERFLVYLTNTLEPIEPQKNLLVPELTHETEAAQKVKKQPILVITGNPPYAAASRNRGEWITKAIEAYKMVDGAHFGERKHWLHDDYVKFMRFAQMKMDEVEEGVVGVITNHSWLDNPTFRGMRQSLMRTFNQIYVLDLHGNFKKKERAPDGSVDQNVFDIEQGVAISLFVKRPNLERGVWRSDLWGERLRKYEATAQHDFGAVKWRAIDASSPRYLFQEISADRKGEYDALWSLLDLMPNNTPGVITARDTFAVAMRFSELEARVGDLVRTSLADEEIRSRYRLPDTRGWKLPAAREALRKSPDWRLSRREMLQAPFDIRTIPHDIRLIDWGRWTFDKRVPRKTPGLCLTRKVDIQRPWEHLFVADELISHHAVSMKEVNYFFPIEIDASENFGADFRDFIDSSYGHHYTPEEVLGYIYAVLHAPTYRARYAEFLRIDFPRIPFAEKSADFETLSALGWALVEAHLLRKVKRRGLGKYRGKKQGEDENRVVAVRYDEDEQAAYINDAQRFAPIPPDVWNFHIGGYQVLDKYLKSRKSREGRVLTLDEIEHVAKVADVLAFTIEQMAAIDDAYKAAFPQQTGAGAVGSG